MKKAQLISLIFVLSLFLFGCSQNYEGVWYGLYEDAVIYGEKDINSYPKIILQENGSYTSDDYGSGAYYIDEETLFLTSDDNYNLMVDISIGSRSDAGKKLNIKDSGFGKALITEYYFDHSLSGMVYYSSENTWEKAWNKLEKAKTEELDTILKEYNWCYYDDYYNELVVYQFDGEIMTSCIGTYDSEGNVQADEVLIHGAEYEVIGPSTISVSIPPQGAIVGDSIQEVEEKSKGTPQDYYIYLSKEMVGYDENDFQYRLQFEYADGRFMMTTIDAYSSGQYGY